MGTNFNRQAQILNLRLQNKSYGEIATRLGISESTVGYWLTDNPTSKIIGETLAVKSRKENGKRLGIFSKNRWAVHRAEAKKEAGSEFYDLINHPLFVAGIMLYWGEGDKMMRGSLRITNTDPKMIKIYLAFLDVIMKIPKEKIKAELILYPDLSDSMCKDFWIKTTELPPENFMATQYISGRHPTKKLSYGICMIYVNSIYQKIKVLTWIDIFSQTYIIKENAGIV